MAEVPVISLVASAIETGLWRGFMDAFKDTKVPYEVVFVGNKRPDFSHPNLRFIYSEVKPAQCHQIAAHEAKGRILGLTADDAIYPSGMLDDVAEIVNNSVCLCPDTFERNQYCTWDSFRLGNFIMAPFGFFTKENWLAVGGYDNRYITGQFENDFFMKLHRAGVNFVPYVNQKPIVVNHIASSQFSRYHEFGRRQLCRSWSYEEFNIDKPMEHMGIVLNRVDVACPYVMDETIYTKNQGAVNEQWK